MEDIAVRVIASVHCSRFELHDSHPTAALWIREMMDGDNYGCIPLAATNAVAPRVWDVTVIEHR